MADQPAPETAPREQQWLSRPSWRQLRAIPESLTKRRVIAALGVYVPREGVSDFLCLDGMTFQVGQSGLLIVTHQGQTQFMDPMEALSTMKLSKGTPSGDLARWWLETHSLLQAKPNKQP
jgi:hypothetical protein